MARVRLYFATSLDGFIADGDGGVDWLHPYNTPEAGYAEFLAEIRTVVLGRATYDHARGFGPWEYAGKRGIVWTSRALADLPEGVERYDRDEAELARRLRALEDGDVWIVGGAKTQAALLGAVDLVDVFVVPLVLGGGVPMFGAVSSKRLRLVESGAFRNGLVHLRYETELSV